MMPNKPPPMPIPFRGILPRNKFKFSIKNPNAYRQITMPKTIEIANVYAYLEDEQVPQLMHIAQKVNAQERQAAFSVTRQEQHITNPEIMEQEAAAAEEAGRREALKEDIQKTLAKSNVAPLAKTVKTMTEVARAAAAAATRGIYDIQETKRIEDLLDRDNEENLQRIAEEEAMRRAEEEARGEAMADESTITEEEWQRKEREREEAFGRELESAAAEHRSGQAEKETSGQMPVPNQPGNGNTERNQGNTDAIPNEEDTTGAGQDDASRTDETQGGTDEVPNEEDTPGTSQDDATGTNTTQGGTDEVPNEEDATGTGQDDASRTDENQGGTDEVPNTETTDAVPDENDSTDASNIPDPLPPEDETHHTSTMDDGDPAPTDDASSGPDVPVPTEETTDHNTSETIDEEDLPKAILFSVEGNIPTVTAFEETFAPRKQISEIWFKLQDAAFEHARTSQGCFDKIEFFFDAAPFQPQLLPKDYSTSANIVRFIRNYMEENGTDTSYYDSRYQDVQQFIPEVLDEIGLNEYSILKKAAHWDFRLFVKKNTRLVFSGGGYTMLKNMGFNVSGGSAGSPYTFSNEGPNSPEWKVFSTKLAPAKTKITTEVTVKAIIDPRPVYDIAAVPMTERILETIKSSYEALISFVNANAFATISRNTGHKFEINPVSRTPVYYNMVGPDAPSMVQDSSQLGGPTIFPTQYNIYPPTISGALVISPEEWVATDENLAILAEMLQKNVSMETVQERVDSMIFEKTEGRMLPSSANTSSVSDPTNTEGDSSTENRSRNKRHVSNDPMVHETAPLNQETQEDSTLPDQQQESHSAENEGPITTIPSTTIATMTTRFPKVATATQTAPPNDEQIPPAKIRKKRDDDTDPGQQNQSIMLAQKELLYHLKKNELVRRIGPLYLSFTETSMSNLPLGDVVLNLLPSNDGTWRQMKNDVVLIPQSRINENAWNIVVKCQATFDTGEKRSDYATLDLPLSLFITGTLIGQIHGTHPQ